MRPRSFAATALAALVVLLPATAADPVVTHKDVPGALKEAKALRVPAFVVLTKAKAAAPTAADARIVRASGALACAAAPLTPALAKQYDLDGEAHILVLDPDGAVIEKFAPDAPAEKMAAALTKRVAEARAELAKAVTPDADAKTRKAALAGLTRLGPLAEDLIPFLTDKDPAIKAAARKTLAAVPLDAAMTPLLDALKSDDPAIRVAVHPLAVQATGYKGSPLKVWQSGTAEERAGAWAKWDEHVQTQFPPLNRAVLAYAERSLGAKVTNGQCSVLASEAFREAGAEPMRPMGETYIWGRELKAGEPVLPGDIAQFERTKFSNGGTYPHHTAVIRKVLAPNRYETLEQNVTADQKVRIGKLEMDKLTEGTVVIYRPLPK
jgi:hypothetical protein